MNLILRPRFFFPSANVFKHLPSDAFLVQMRKQSQVLKCLGEAEVYISDLNNMSDSRREAPKGKSRPTKEDGHSSVLQYGESRMKWTLKCK